MIDRETKYKLRIEKRGLNIPIDKTAENYRCCLNCAYEFMADHSRDKYCCEWCHDQFNNAKRKQKYKEMKAALAASQIEPIEISSTLNRNDFKQLVYTNKFLKGLFKDGVKEVKCSVNYLIKNGVDLRVHEGKIPLKSNMDNITRYITVIRSFTIERINIYSVLIKNY